MLSMMTDKEASKLVTEGAYRYSRNPMYLGMVIALVGLWPMTGGYWPALPLVLFIWVISSKFILWEEARLEELFGDEYRDYKAHVWRWI